MKEKDKESKPQFAFAKKSIKITTRITDATSKGKFFTSRNSVRNERSIASTGSQVNDWVSNSVL